MFNVSQDCNDYFLRNPMAKQVGHVAYKHEIRLFELTSLQNLRVDPRLTGVLLVPIAFCQFPSPTIRTVMQTFSAKRIPSPRDKRKHPGTAQDSASLGTSMILL